MSFVGVHQQRMLWWKRSSTLLFCQCFEELVPYFAICFTFTSVTCICIGLCTKVNHNQWSYGTRWSLFWAWHEFLCIILNGYLTSKLFFFSNLRYQQWGWKQGNHNNPASREHKSIDWHLLQYQCGTKAGGVPLLCQQLSKPNFLSFPQCPDAYNVCIYF